MPRAPTASSRIAAWAVATRDAGVPKEVAAAFAPHILDALGCAIGAWRKGAAIEAARIAEPTAGGHAASIIARREAFTAEDAAFANGTLIHGLDFDDTHGLSVTHATAAVLPAALAVGEAHDRPGRDVQVATILGVEAICRLGAAARNQFHLRGFHPSSVCGVFGSALAAALLLGAGEAEIANALGLAGSFASGLFACLEGGGNPKPFHVGHAARDGVAAARLARAGATGPDTVIEGRFGLYDAFIGTRQTELSGQLATLGRVWECTRLSIKPYPACHSMHACLDGAAMLQAEHGFKAGDIAAIEVIMAGQREVALTLEPLDAKRRPDTPTAARFSLPFSVAHLLIKGTIDIDTADPENLADPAVLALADTVTYRLGEFPTGGSALPGGVEIRLRSGEVLRRLVPVERGGPENPLPLPAIVDKYQGNVGGALAAADRERLREVTLEIEWLERLDSLASFLRRVGGKNDMQCNQREIPADTKL